MPNSLLLLCVHSPQQVICLYLQLVEMPLVADTVVGVKVKTQKVHWKAALEVEKKQEKTSLLQWLHVVQQVCRFIVLASQDLLSEQIPWLSGYWSVSEGGGRGSDQLKAMQTSRPIINTNCQRHMLCLWVAHLSHIAQQPCRRFKVVSFRSLLGWVWSQC